MIKLSQVSKSYNNGKSYAVKEINLTIHNGEIVVLLGSSGCGKTTLLKMINRLVEPSSGCIEFNGKNIKQIARTQLRKQMGYVIQSVGLFPHMTIERNIAIVLELMGVDKVQRQKRAYELLKLIHLDPTTFAQRYPDELSGGQQQRVGVARALASDPKCLLMDEPFGALDAISRSALQEEMLELNANLKKIIVFVTHDIAEAFRIADRIVVMNDGEINQIGTKDELMHQPKTAFVKKLIQNFSQQIEDYS